MTIHKRRAKEAVLRQVAAARRQWRGAIAAEKRLDPDDHSRRAEQIREAASDARDHLRNS